MGVCSRVITMWLPTLSHTLTWSIVLQQVAPLSHTLPKFCRLSTVLMEKTLIYLPGAPGQHVPNLISSGRCVSIQIFPPRIFRPSRWFPEQDNMAALGIAVRVCFTNSKFSRPGVPMTYFRCPGRVFYFEKWSSAIAIPTTHTRLRLRTEAKAELVWPFLQVSNTTHPFCVVFMSQTSEKHLPYKGSVSVMLL